MRLRFGLTLHAALVLLAGCHSGCGDRPLPDPPPKTVPTEADLVAFHRQRAQQIDSLITSLAADWEGCITTGTGLRIQRLDSVPGSPRIDALAPGTVLELHHRFSLLDGRSLTDWRTDGPMAFEWERTDLPSGFHELIGRAAIGDSVRALIPPSRAWGMSGLPPEIPQEAVILVTMRIRPYTRPS